MIKDLVFHLKGKGKRSSMCIAHRREHASNVLLSLTRAACHTATVCSLQTPVSYTHLTLPTNREV